MIHDHPVNGQDLHLGCGHDVQEQDRYRQTVEPWWVVLTSSAQELKGNLRIQVHPKAINTLQKKKIGTYFYLQINSV